MSNTDMANAGWRETLPPRTVHRANAMHRARTVYRAVVSDTMYAYASPLRRRQTHRKTTLWYCRSNSMVRCEHSFDSRSWFYTAKPKWQTFCCVVQLHDDAIHRQQPDRWVE